MNATTTAYGHELTVSPDAHLSGVLRARVNRATISDAAEVGARDVAVGSSTRVAREFLLWRAAYLSASFVAGCWWWSRRRTVLLAAAAKFAAWWTCLTRGLLLATAFVVVTVALAVTVVGLPVALAGAAAFLLLWLSAQSVAAAALTECPGPHRGLPFPVRLSAGFGVLFLLSLPGYGIGATASTLAGLVGLGAIMGVAVVSRSA